MARPTSLRDFRAPRRHSRVVVDVAERSQAAWTAAASDGGALPPPPPPADGLLHHLTAQQCEQVTHTVLRAFLEADVSGAVDQQTAAPPSQQDQLGGEQQQRLHPPAAGHARHQHASRRRQHGGAAGAAASAGPADGAPPASPPRGVQGRVVAHLLAGGFDEALLEPVPAHTLNWAVKVLGEQGAVAAAEQLFHWMRLKGRASEHSLAKLCEGCGAAGQPWRALRAWRVTRRMPQAPAVTGTRSAAALVLAYRTTADHRGAVAALDALQQHSWPADRYAFNAAIRVCADAGAADDALRLLARLREAAAAQRQQQQQPPGPGAGGLRGRGSAQGRQGWRAGLFTDCRTYSAVLAALAAGGACHRCAQVHRWLREDGVVPDAPLCTQLLSCYAAAGQAAPAQQLLDAMAAGVGGLPAPNRTHRNATLAAHAAAGDVAAVAAGYRALLAAQQRPDAHSLLAVLRAAFHAGQGLAAVRAVRAELATRRLPLTLELGTAMLCCLRHVRPAPGELQLGPAAEHATGDGDGGGGAAAGRQQQRLRLRRGGARPGDGGAPDESQACLAEAADVFARLRARAGGGGAPLDLRAYNSLLLVRLAAGDHAGVLAAFGELEAERDLLPDDTTLGVVIAACRAAGWAQREEQYTRLLQGSRLLGALRGDEPRPRRGGRRRAA